MIAFALRDAGAEVIYLGLRQSPAAIVAAAVAEDADLIGISVLSGAHLPLAEQILAQRAERGAEHIPVVIGGTIPAEHVGRLREMGVDAVYPVGSPLPDVVAGLLALRRRAGGGERPERAARAGRAGGDHDRCAEVDTRPVLRHDRLGDPGGGRLHGRRPARRRGRAGAAARPARRAAVHPRARTRPCTAASCGPCGSSPASARRSTPTSGSGSCSARGRPRCRSRSTCPPSSATTPATRWPPPRSAGSASRSTPRRTCATSSTGIPLDKVSVNFTINATAPIILATYLVAAERSGVPFRALTGTLQNDILKEFLARKAYLYPPGPSLRLVTDVVEFSSRELPRFNPISITGYHAREAGCDAVQELALTMASAIAYCEAFLARGMDFEAFAPRLSFHFATTLDLFEEVAKLRAARRIWHRVATERFGATSAGGGAAALLLRQLGHHADRAAAAEQRDQVDPAVPRRGAGRRPVHPRHGLRRGLRDPERGGGHAVAADAADHRAGIRRNPDGRPAGRLVLRGAADRRDRGAGLRADGRHRRDRRRGRGDRGWHPAALDRRVRLPGRAGTGQRRAAEGRRERLRRPGDGGAGAAATFEVDPLAGERQAARTRARMADRDPGPLTSALLRLADDTRAGRNVMPALIDAARAGATVGEMADVFRDAFGEFTEAGAVVGGAAADSTVPGSAVPGGAAPALPLRGVRVADLTRFVAGSQATMWLTALGAEVVKVEPPSGDPYRTQGTERSGGESVLFMALNAGKRSLAVDFRTPAGREVMDRLLGRCDMFVENSRPGSLATHGLDWESVHDRFPHIVYGSISGYGDVGPDAARGGFDLILQAESGVMSVTGSPQSGPVKVGAPFLDVGAGLSCACGLLAGYIERLRTGTGTPGVLVAARVRPGGPGHDPGQRRGLRS